jgi:hypothetical protein
MAQGLNALPKQKPPRRPLPLPSSFDPRHLFAHSWARTSPEATWASQDHPEEPTSPSLHPTSPRFYRVLHEAQGLLALPRGCAPCWRRKVFLQVVDSQAHPPGPRPTAVHGLSLPEGRGGGRALRGLSGATSSMPVMNGGALFSLGLSFLATPGRQGEAEPAPSEWLQGGLLEPRLLQPQSWVQGVKTAALSRSGE